MEIRRLAAADVADVVELWHATKRATYDFLATERDRTLGEDDAFFRAHVLDRCEIWLALADGALLGFLALAGGYLDRLYVAPDAQRRGVGATLFRQGAGAVARRPRASYAPEEPRRARVLRAARLHRGAFRHEPGARARARRRVSLAATLTLVEELARAPRAPHVGAGPIRSRSSNQARAPQLTTHSLEIRTALDDDLVEQLATSSCAPNQEHRAEVAKLRVHRRARREGLASRLMTAQARAAGFRLLTLDTPRGDHAEGSIASSVGARSA